MTVGPVTICAADAGCAEALGPVVRRLQPRAEVRVLADSQGAAAARLAGALGADGPALPIQRVPTVSPEQVSDSPLLLCATAGKRQRFALGASAAARLAGARVVWLETHYQAARLGENSSFVPDHLVVTDRHAAALHPTPYRARIHVLGQPAFDGLSAARAQGAAARQAFRREHALGEEQKLLAFFASSSAQVDPDEAIAPICELLRRRPDVSLLARLHPADPRADALRHELERRVERLILTSASDVAAIGCADAVTVQHSTVGLKAVMLETPTLYLLSSSVRRHLTRQGIAPPTLPPVTEGAALAARTHREAIAQLTRLLDDPRTRTRLLACQRARFPRRTDAARAIANLVLGLI